MNTMKLLLSISLICLLIVPLGACQSEPDTEPTGNIDNAEAARDAAIEYLSPRDSA